MGETAGSILALMTGPLASVFGGASWAAWRAVLRGAFGLPLDQAARQTLQQLTGRTAAPTTPARELWWICGRRAGKSIIAALIAVWATCCRTYRLAPGERGIFMVLAADRRQARVIRRYIGGLLQAHPALAALMAHETAERIELTTGILIEIHTASFRSVRGYTVIGAVLDEIAFWPTDEAADPDREILAALRPAMATVPSAVLVALSTPYGRKGELWRAYQEHYGHDHDDVFVVQSSTRGLNPTVPQTVIDRAMAEDESVAAAEYHGQFRRDLESFVSREVLGAAVVPDRHELPPRSSVTYAAFVDPSGGSSDSMTLAIAHREGERIVLDAVRERTAPFNPDAVVADFATLLAQYRVTTVTGDRYGSEWPVARFRAAGITYRPAEKTKSELYTVLLPKLNAALEELVEAPQLVPQLAARERRTARSGKDSIDHPPRQRDDVANSVAGVVQQVIRASEHGPYIVTIAANRLPPPSLALQAIRRARQRRAMEPQLLEAT